MSDEINPKVEPPKAEPPKVAPKKEPELTQHERIARESGNTSWGR